MRDTTWLHRTAARCVVALSVIPTVWPDQSLGDVQGCLALLLATLLISQLSHVASAWNEAEDADSMDISSAATMTPGRLRKSTLRLRKSTLSSTPLREKAIKVKIQRRRTRAWPLRPRPDVGTLRKWVLDGLMTYEEGNAHRQLHDGPHSANNSVVSETTLGIRNPSWSDSLMGRTPESGSHTLA